MIDNNLMYDIDHPAHRLHKNLKGKLRKDYNKGDVVMVFDPENPMAHPHHEWLRATVMDQKGSGGEVAVRSWHKCGEALQEHHIENDLNVADEEWVRREGNVLKR